jgi:hypothetical protein
MEILMKSMLAVVAVIVTTAAVAGAQERAADLHLGYSRTTQSHLNSWGAGAALQLTWGGSNAPIKVNTSPAADYMKQEKSGPGTASVSLDVTAQPGGSSSLTPYAGGSVSENWSTGSAKQWTGARHGLEAIGGIQYKPSPSSTLSWKLEERYGYIYDSEHMLTTRAGVLISF